MKKANAKTKVFKLGTGVFKRLKKLYGKPKKGFWSRLFEK